MSNRNKCLNVDYDDDVDFTLQFLWYLSSTINQRIIRSSTVNNVTKFEKKRYDENYLHRSLC